MDVHDTVFILRYNYAFVLPRGLGRHGRLFFCLLLLLCHVINSYDIRLLRYYGLDHDETEIVSLHTNYAAEIPQMTSCVFA